MKYVEIARLRLVPVVKHHWEEVAIWNMHYKFFLLTPFESKARRLQKHTRPRSFQIQTNPTKLRVASNFCLIKFLTKSTAEAPEPHLALFWPPLGVRVEGVQPNQVPKKPRTFPPSRTTSLLNFVAISPAVWISTYIEHSYIQTHIALF